MNGEGNSLGGRQGKWWREWSELEPAVDSQPRERVSRVADTTIHTRQPQAPLSPILGSVARAAIIMAAMSPSSSPRLPSPPPIAEDQLGPKSPIAEEHGSEPVSVDQGSARRIRPGTKAQDMADGPPLADLKDVSVSVNCYHCPS